MVSLVLRTTLLPCDPPRPSEEELAAECAQARDLGFDGKTLIHPGTIAATNAAFCPSDEEVDFATRVVEAARLARESGEGMCIVDGLVRDREALRSPDCNCWAAASRAVTSHSRAPPPLYPLRPALFGNLLWHSQLIEELHVDHARRLLEVHAAAQRA